MDSRGDLLSQFVDRSRGRIRWIRHALLMIAVVCLLAFPSGAGQRAPRSYRLDVDFEATDLESRPFRGLSLKGKTVLLDFWAVWCAPCLKAMPTLSRLHTDFAEQNFQVLGIAAYSGSPADVREFLKEHRLAYPVVVGDEDLVERYGVIGYPTYFLIGPDGTVRKKFFGEVDNLYQAVAAELISAHREIGRP